MATRKQHKEIRELRIGKNGITQGFIEEVKEQLEKSPELKIHLPRGQKPADRDIMAKELAEKTGTKLLDRRGNTARITKKK